MTSPTTADAASGSDSSLRFLFEDADIRGESVHLDEAYRAITRIHQYAPGVRRLLGEFLAAAVLLSSNLKFEGRIILQARSEGQLPLLMAECTSSREVRAIARGAERATSERFDALLPGGQLAITVDPTDGQRYQGVVPLLPSSLAASLESYFAQSEQLSTRIWLASDGSRAAGMLLQQLPATVAATPERRQRDWENACSLAATLTEAELLALPAAELLHRLFHQQRVRLFAEQAVNFRCSCSRERTLDALQALDRSEIEELLAELGSITMDCEFCNQQYRFLAEDLAASGGPTKPKSMH